MPFKSLLILAILFSSVIHEKCPYFFAIIFIIYFIYKGVPEKFEFIGNRVIFFLPFLVFISWMYGVIVALASSVPLTYALSNFAGMSLFIIYYGLHSLRFSREEIYQLIRCAFYLSLFYNGFLYFSSGSVDLSQLDYSLDSLRIKYSIEALYIFIFIFMYSYYIKAGHSGNESRLFMQGNVAKTLMLVPASFIFIFLSLSKGYMILYAGFFILLLLNLSPAGKIKIFIFIICFYFLVSVFIDINYLYDLIYMYFSIDNSSNSIRSEQFNYLFDEISFFGSGLGASLASGYTRDETGYGFELSYLSLVHKLGVFSIFYFILISSNIGAFYDKKISLESRYLGVSLLAYLIPGIGNPIIFAPSLVVLTCISSYILSTKRF